MEIQLYKILCMIFDAANITAFATVVLAVFAFFTAKYAKKAFEAQNVLIKNQKKADSLQFSFYKNTTRPFLYIKTFGIESFGDPLNLFIVSYITNCGSLPAENVEVFTKFFPKVDLSESIKFDIAEPAKSILVVPPGIDKPLKISKEFNSNSLSEELIGEKIIIAIKYQDIDENAYSYVAEYLIENIYYEKDERIMNYRIIAEYIDLKKF